MNHGRLLGIVLGGLFGLGACAVFGAVIGARQRRFAARVLAYVQDLPGLGRPAGGSGGFLTREGLRALIGVGARGIERVLGGGASVERRLRRLGSDLTLHDFRVAQVRDGLVVFALAAVPAAWISLRDPGRAIPLLLSCGAAALLAVLLRENRLTAAVSARERQMLQEFPSVVTLLALAMAAGEGPVAALHRVTSRSHGELARELTSVLATTRTGRPVAMAFDDLASRTGLPVLARFAEAVAIAVERGTPLTDVLHAQAADVREASRRELIEIGARKEVLMMLPVVFVVLPIVIVFAFFPGLVGLRLVV
ncbi:MAG TPA: type II secretion system F family protein [Marmoricola sp.]